MIPQPAERVTFFDLPGQFFKLFYILKLNPCLSYECLTVFIFVQVKSLPWNEDDLAPETTLLVNDLADINKHGFLTINSQPNVNAATSTDPVVGWGGPGGYIYQKVRTLKCCGT